MHFHIKYHRNNYPKQPRAHYKSTTNDKHHIRNYLDNANAYIQRLARYISSQPQSTHQTWLDALLIDTAAAASPSTIQTLLDAGADIHAGDDQALRMAAMNGHTDIVTLLIEADADILAHNGTVRLPNPNQLPELIQ